MWIWQRLVALQYWWCSTHEIKLEVKCVRYIYSFCNICLVFLCPSCKIAREQMFKWWWTCDFVCCINCWLYWWWWSLLLLLLGILQALLLGPIHSLLGIISRMWTDCYDIWYTSTGQLSSGKVMLLFVDCITTIITFLRCMYMCDQKQLSEGLKTILFFRNLWCIWCGKRGASDSHVYSLLHTF